MDSPVLVLERPLGSGRMGRVWRARLLEDFAGRAAGAPLAVKVLGDEWLADREARKAFAVEAEALRAVRHAALPHFVCAGLDSPPPFASAGASEVDGAARPDPRAPWIAMDLVPGPTLEEELAARGPLPEPSLRAAGRRVADALAAMHAAGWSHGDVKPENLRLDARGDAVLMDLGFARRAGAAPVARGTPLYLAPERASGAPAEPASDVFALGATLFRLATGAHATLDGDGQGATPARASVRPPSSLVPRLSPFLDDLLLACLAESPDVRPTAADVARALAKGETSEWWRERVSFGAEARRDTAAWSGTHQLPLVGRSEELERLHVAWHAARTRGVAVWLEGERGAGKSRLVAELAHRVRRSDAEAPLYLYGRCGEFEDERPGAAIFALLHRWLHLPRGAAPGMREVESVRALLPEAEARTLLDALSDETDSRAELPVTEVAALSTWLSHLTRTTPAIVFLDDLDSAGKTTLDVLGRVARDLASLRLLLVLGMRGDGAPLHPPGIEALRTRLASSERIVLGPLDEHAVLELVDLAFHASVPRRSLARVLASRSGGNPGRIGELLRLAETKGWVAPSKAPGGGLELRIAPSALPRPASLARAVMARRESLPPRDRVWLERFAVLGGRIGADLAARAYPRSRTSAAAALTRLTETGWLVPAGSRFRFARPVERDEVLRSIPAARRRRFHRAAARAFEGGHPAGEDAYRRVRHLRKAEAARELLAELPPLLERSREAGHPRRRATLAGFGLEALDTLPSTPENERARRELLETLADASDRLGERDEQRQALEALAETPLDFEREPAAAGRVYMLHARAAVRSGEAGLARGLLLNAIDLFRSAGAPASDELASAYVLTARVESDAGDLAGAGRWLAAAREAAPNALRRAEALAVIGEVAALEDRWDDGLAAVEEALRELELAPDSVRTRAVRGNVQLVRGRLLVLVGATEEAWSALGEAAALADQSGEVRLAVEAAARRGRLMLDVDRERDAELELREALLLARTVEDRRGEALVSLFLGTLLAERGDGEAEGTLERSQGIAAELGLNRIEALGAAIHARVDRMAGRLDDAIARIERAAESVERYGAELTDRIVVDATRALLLRATGRRREARALQGALESRVRAENRRIAERRTRARQRRMIEALVRAALSPEGPVYPRVRRSGLPDPA